MRILICEDEAPASKMLFNLIKEVEPSVEIIAIVETGEEAINVINKENLDLIFMDIELADGSCFETLAGIELNTPVIFTTAYDEYALKAFELNGIYYLVKPISIEKVQKALSKFFELKKILGDEGTFKFSNDFLTRKCYKNRFLVKLGRKLFPIGVNKIAYFMARDKMVWLVTNNDKKYIVNFTLSELEETLNPTEFFRLNRQFLAALSSIKNLEPYFKGQVTVSLLPNQEEVIVSRNKTPELKAWLKV